MTFPELIEKCGITIWPLLFLSILSLSTIFERIWFWTKMLLQEGQVLDSILETASRNWQMVEGLARENRRHPLGRFLYAPLRLVNPEPEVFHLALESAADDELSQMRRGDKILEAVIALSPLLGLLGTVLGLIRSLGDIQISDLGTASTSNVTLGIGEALISTAVGLIVAITSLAFYRVFQAFWSNQVRVFRKAGSQLEVVYRQRWHEGEDNSYVMSANLDPADQR